MSPAAGRNLEPAVARQTAASLEVLPPVRVDTVFTDSLNRQASRVVSVRRPQGDTARRVRLPLARACDQLDARGSYDGLGQPHGLW